MSDNFIFANIDKKQYINAEDFGDNSGVLGFQGLYGYAAAMLFDQNVLNTSVILCSLLFIFLMGDENGL